MKPGIGDGGVPVGPGLSWAGCSLLLPQRENMPDVMNGMRTLLHITDSVYESWIFFFLFFWFRLESAVVYLLQSLRYHTSKD